MIKFVKNSLHINAVRFQPVHMQLTENQTALMRIQSMIIKQLLPIMRLDNEASMRKNILNEAFISTAIEPLVEAVKKKALLVNKSTNVMSTILQPSISYKLLKETVKSEEISPDSLSKTLFVLLHQGFTWKGDLDKSITNLINMNTLLEDYVAIIKDPIDLNYLRKNILGQRDHVSEYLYKCIKLDLSLQFVNYAISNRMLNIAALVGADYRFYANTIGAAGNIMFAPGAGIYPQILTLYYLIIKDIYENVYMPVIDKYRKMMVLLQNRSKMMLIKFFNEIPDDFVDMNDQNVSWLSANYKELKGRMTVMEKYLDLDVSSVIVVKDVDIIGMRVFDTLAEIDGIDINELPEDFKSAISSLIKSTLEDNVVGNIKLDWDKLMRSALDKLQEEQYGYNLLSVDMIQLKKRLESENVYKLCEKYDINGTKNKNKFSMYNKIGIDEIVNIIPQDEIIACSAPTWIGAKFEVDQGYYQTFFMPLTQEVEIRVKRESNIKILQQDTSKSVIMNENATLRVGLGTEIDNENTDVLLKPIERVMIEMIPYVGQVSTKAMTTRLDVPTLKDIAEMCFLMRQQWDYRAVSISPRALIVEGGILYESSIMINDKPELIRQKMNHNLEFIKTIANWITLNDKELALCEGVEFLKYQHIPRVVLIIENGTIYLPVAATDVNLKDKDILQLDNMEVLMNFIEVGLLTPVKQITKKVPVFGVSLSAIKRLKVLQGMTNYDFANDISEFSLRVAESFPAAIMLKCGAPNVVSTLVLTESSTLPSDTSAMININALVPIDSPSFFEPIPLDIREFDGTELKMNTTSNRFKGISSFWNLARIESEVQSSSVKTGKKNSKTPMVKRNPSQELSFIFYMCNSSDINKREMVRYNIGLGIFDEYARLMRTAPCSKADADLLTTCFNWNGKEIINSENLKVIEQFKRNANNNCMSYAEYKKAMIKAIIFERRENDGVIPIEAMFPILYYLTPASLLVHDYIFTENFISFRRFGYGNYFDMNLKRIYDGNYVFIKDSFTRLRFPRYEWSDVIINNDAYSFFVLYQLSLLYNGLIGIFKEHTLAKNLKGPDLTGIFSNYSMMLFNKDVDAFRKKCEQAKVNQTGFVHLIEFPDIKSNVVSLPYITMLNSEFMSKSTIYEKARLFIGKAMDSSEINDADYDRDLIERRIVDLLCFFVWSRILNIRKMVVT